MSDKFLQREDAPFSAEVWEKIDGAVIGAAKSQLSARRLLAVQGPYGLGLKHIPCSDRLADGKGVAENVTMAASCAAPVVAIQTTFAVAARDIATLEQTGLPMDLQPAAEAALACARQEDALLFYGAESLHASGLLTAKGTLSQKLAQWSEVGAAVGDVIEAVTKLDAAGFHGPYALALAPALYNLLFRRYAQGPMTELEHLKQVVTDGIVKAPSIKAGGVVLATGSQFASIIVGQDMKVGFVGPVGNGYELTISETLALRLAAPSSVCALK